ncbi:MAG: hypothetical protein ACJARP_003015, partial [Vicingaceae bacterium]
MQNSKIINTSKSPAQIKDLLTAQAEHDSWRFALITPKKDFLYKDENGHIEFKANRLDYWPLIILELQVHIEPRCRIIFSGLILYTIVHLLFISLLFFLIVLALNELSSLDISKKKEIALLC